MSFDTAKRAVDFFLDNSKYFNTDAVIWDFIGGEPLLEIELIDQICDYIKIKTYELGHKWFNEYRISMSTNGTLYHKKQVRDFIMKNRMKCSIGISIDGTKEKHDLQRIHSNGEGSYDEVIGNIPLWLAEFPTAATKVTIGREDLRYLKDSIIHLWDLGIKSVPANVVFEDVWQEGDDAIFEQQLRELADYILDNQLWNKVNTSLFDDKIGFPNDDYSLKRNNCGTGKMIAVDPDGTFYPCLRYIDYCLVNQDPYIIGNINDGIDFDKIRPFLAVNTANQSSDECIDCEVALGCGWCQGSNYDCSEIGTNYQRAKFICEMHKARCRANNYYWWKLEKNTGVKRDKYPHKRHLFFILADNSVEHCNYTSNANGESVMNEEILKQAFEFAERNFFKPVILHPKIGTINYDISKFSKTERIEITSGFNESIIESPASIIPVVYADSIGEILPGKNCILVLDESSLPHMAENINKLLTKVDRININFRAFSKEMESTYEKQLTQIIDVLVQYYKQGVMKEVNLLTDRLFLNRMDNCEAGNYNYTVAPNGKLYICPAFYYSNPHFSIGSLDEGITVSREYFQLKNAPYCIKCDAYHCNRCLYLNKKYTGEFNIPSSSQCKKSHLERQFSMTLRERLRAENVTSDFEHINPLKYNDPIELILDDLELNPYNNKYC